MATRSARLGSYSSTSTRRLEYSSISAGGMWAAGSTRKQRPSRPAPTLSLDDEQALRESAASMTVLYVVLGCGTSVMKEPLSRIKPRATRAPTAALSP